MLLERHSSNMFSMPWTLEGTREACFLGGLFCRRPVLTDPAPSPRCALCPDPPVVCSGFGLDKFQLTQFQISPENVQFNYSLDPAEQGRYLYVLPAHSFVEYISWHICLPVIAACSCTFRPTPKLDDCLMRLVVATYV